MLIIEVGTTRGWYIINQYVGIQRDIFLLQFLSSQTILFLFSLIMILEIHVLNNKCLNFLAYKLTLKYHHGKKQTNKQITIKTFNNEF